MSDSKLEQRIAKQEQSLAKIQKALALSKKTLRDQERKQRSRRLILVGVHAEKLCETDQNFREKLEKYIDESEQTLINRKLFDFLPEGKETENTTDKESYDDSPKTHNDKSKYSPG